MGHTPRLVEALRAGRWLHSPPVADAIEAVDRGLFVSQGVRRYAEADVALPYLDFTPHGLSIQPSPRTHALLLELLEPKPGLSVLVAGARSGWLPALVARIVGRGHVTVIEYDAAERGWAEDALERAGMSRWVEFRDDLPSVHGGARWDRILATTPVVTLPPAYRDLLADGGFLIGAVLGESRYGVMKLVRSGDSFVDIGLANVAVGPPEFRGAAPLPDGGLGPHPRDPAAKFTLGHLLSLESLAGHVWQDRVLTKDDAHFREAVERTWSPPGKHRTEAEEARNFFHLGYVYQSVGDLPTAVVLYSCSLDVMPTSEAHTFRGWAYSFLGRTDDAIRECEDAIAVDPSFGNPYNDLGAYLLERGQLDEAEDWLERAKRAPRYDALFYPYANLGRLYILRGEREKARRELTKALEINPHYTVAADLLRRLDKGGDA